MLSSSRALSGTRSGHLPDFGMSCSDGEIVWHILASHESFRVSNHPFGPLKRDRIQSTQVYKYQGQLRTFKPSLGRVWVSSSRTRSRAWHCGTPQPGPGLGEGLRLGAFEQSKPTPAEIALILRSLSLSLTLAHSPWTSVRFRHFVEKKFTLQLLTLSLIHI